MTNEKKTYHALANAGNVYISRFSKFLISDNDGYPGFSRPPSFIPKFLRFTTPDRHNYSC